MEHHHSHNNNILIVWTYLPPIIVVVGTAGNILSFITVTNKHCKKSSFTTYIAAFAIVDTVYLLLVVLNSWLHFVFDINLQEINTVTCKLFEFLLLVLGHSSSWLIASLTVERTFCTYFPHKVKTMCRPKTGYVVVGLILGFISALNIHELIGFEYQENQQGTNVTRCGFVNVRYKNFMMYYFSWIEFSLYFLLPVIVIITCNSATVIKIFRNSNTSGMARALDLNRKKRNRHLLVITLLVSFTFLISISPVTLYSTLKPYLFEDADYFFSSTQTEDIVSTIVYHLGFLNHAINFFLYILSGERFRKDLKAAFCKKINHTSQGRTNISQILNASSQM